MRTAVALFAALVCIAAALPGPSPSPATSTGRIVGRIDVAGAARYQGTHPAGESVDMSNDAYCAEAHAGGSIVSRSVVAGPGGGLKDVIVYVREAPAVGSAPEETVLLDQQGCLYAPHVVALRVGQTLVIRNSDETLHNVHIRPNENREINVGQPMRGMESRRTFDRSEVGIRVSCDIHGWMGGVIAVFDHPYFDVTGEDGTFSLDGLPPGQYEVEAWHETLGTQTQTITVGAGGDAAELTFTFGG